MAKYDEKTIGFEFLATAEKTSTNISGDGKGEVTFCRTRKKYCYILKCVQIKNERISTIGFYETKGWAEAKQKAFTWIMISR